MVVFDGAPATQSDVLPTLLGPPPAVPCAGTLGTFGGVTHGTSTNVVLGYVAVKQPAVGVGTFRIVLPQSSRLGPPASSDGLASAAAAAGAVGAVVIGPLAMAIAFAAGDWSADATTEPVVTDAALSTEPVVTDAALSTPVVRAYTR